MLPTHPLISIVTVVFNAGATIKKTLDSVQMQTYKSFEHIIVDGQSTDNTMEIVEAYGAAIAQKISERDKGIYDAMNKGLQMARGEWVIFLNAGDYFHSNTVLAEVSSLMVAENDIIYSDVICDYGSFMKTRIAPDAAILFQAFKKGMAVCHNTVFFRAALHKKTPYNIAYTIAADFDVLLSLLEQGAWAVKYPQPVTTIETGQGVSYRRQVTTLMQHRQVLKAHPHTLLQLLQCSVAIAVTFIKMLIKKLIPSTVTEWIIRFKP